MRENRSSGFLTRSDTNPPVQMARSLRFRIEEEELYYLSYENKEADQFRSYCTADLGLRIGRNPVFSCRGSLVGL